MAAPQEIDVKIVPPFAFQSQMHAVTDQFQLALAQQGQYATYQPLSLSLSGSGSGSDGSSPAPFAGSHSGYDSVPQTASLNGSFFAESRNGSPATPPMAAPSPRQIASFLTPADSFLGHDFAIPSGPASWVNSSPHTPLAQGIHFPQQKQPGHDAFDAQFPPLFLDPRALSVNAAAEQPGPAPKPPTLLIPACLTPGPISDDQAVTPALHSALPSSHAVSPFAAAAPLNIQKPSTPEDFLLLSHSHADKRSSLFDLSADHPAPTSFEHHNSLANAQHNNLGAHILEPIPISVNPNFAQQNFEQFNFIDGGIQDIPDINLSDFSTAAPAFVPDTAAPAPAQTPTHHHFALDPFGQQSPLNPPVFGFSFNPAQIPGNSLTVNMARTKAPGSRRFSGTPAPAQQSDQAGPLPGEVSMIDSGLGPSDGSGAPATARRGRKKSLTADPTKTFVCEICCQAFRRQEHLKRHYRSLHTQEKPYSCDQCGKQFSRSDNLSQHLRTHGKDMTIEVADSAWAPEHNENGQVFHAMQMHQRSAPMPIDPGRPLDQNQTAVGTHFYHSVVNTIASFDDGSSSSSAYSGMAGMSSSEGSTSS